MIIGVWCVAIIGFILGAGVAYDHPEWKKYFIKKEYL